ncbi:MAG: STAS-like domain-containing protein [Nitrospiraceae bacterium]
MKDFERWSRYLSERLEGSRVREFIVFNVANHPSNIARETAVHFGISRVAVGRYLRELVSEGILVATGTTKDRRYELRTIVDYLERIDVTPDLKEDEVWREKVYPFVKDLKENIQGICNWGFTEMLNNAIDHSESPTAMIACARTAATIELTIWDEGIGIFNKIQKRFGLTDPRHALLELSKGKLTTDESKHTGYGIFFTSRAFDKFSISSGTLYFCRLNKQADWFIETDDIANMPGTYIPMVIATNARHTMQEVFDKYVSEFDDGFSATHVPLKLAKYGGEQLVSRSQAKRLLVRVEQFKEVLLDFEGITIIGQAFADEIFRVFQREHPHIRILCINANNDVEKMINLARHPPEETTLEMFS